MSTSDIIVSESVARIFSRFYFNSLGYRKLANSIIIILQIDEGLIQEKVTERISQHVSRNMKKSDKSWSIDLTSAMDKFPEDNPPPPPKKDNHDFNHPRLIILIFNHSCIALLAQFTQDDDSNFDTIR